MGNAIQLFSRRYLQAGRMSALFRTVRQFSTTASRKALGPMPAGFAKIKDRQKMFQIDNGLRIHERGARDGMVFNLTQLLLVVGGVLWVKTVYQMAYPQKA